MTPRDQVYAAVDGERDYQDLKMAGTASSNGPGGGMMDRSIDEYALLLTGQANELIRLASSGGSAAEKLACMRKAAALAVAGMEAHGAVPR